MKSYPAIEMKATEQYFPVSSAVLSCLFSASLVDRTCILFFSVVLGGRST